MALKRKKKGEMGIKEGGYVLHSFFHPSTEDDQGCT